MAHLVKNPKLLDNLIAIVLDEADLLLSYGYFDDIETLLPHIPQTAQHFLMSATLSSSVRQLKSLVLRNPVVLELKESDDVNLLTQYIVPVLADTAKFMLTFFLLKLRIHPFGTGKTLIFLNDVERCYKLKLFLEQFGIRTVVLNSELPVKSRFHIVQEFNRGVYDILIATDEGGKREDDDEEDVDIEDLEQEQDVAAEVALILQDQKADAAAAAVTAAATKSSKKKAKAAASKRNPKSAKQDAEYGVSRGIDFQNVQAVLNFDLPKSSRSYMHRVGRTARGVGNEGWALTFYSKSDESGDLSPDELVLKRVQRTQEGMLWPPPHVPSRKLMVLRMIKALGRELKEYAFDMNQVTNFKYRVEDALRSVTRIAIKEARIKELKSEILLSETLKSHFESNPADLRFLRHDRPVHPARVLAHLKHVPDYLVDKELLGGLRGSEKRKRDVGPRNDSMKKRKADVLKSFKLK